MLCPVAQRPFSDLAVSLDSAAIARRLPYMGSLELTYRCNQACRHCFCNLKANDLRQADELTTGQVQRILDELAEAGCLWLLFTGGEVLLRNDFWQVYEYALRKGLLVQVFTNASLIDEAAAARFVDLPPLGIDISFYGSTAALHDAITGSPGSFKRTIEGIERLKKRRVKFSLKTMLMSLNLADLSGMRLLAADLGAEFRYDTLLCPRRDGGSAPLDYRLAPEVMAGLDVAEDFQSCGRIFSGFWNKQPDQALICGAGVFAFNIDPYGVLSPCTMFRSFQYQLKGSAFKDVWQDMAGDYAAGSSGRLVPECASCSMSLICSNCPAWSELETGSMNKKVEYICSYAKCLEKDYFRQKEASEYGKETV